ncbi:MAG: replicative DNA helicase, partial [Chlorobiaceae bacterium]|nr:replicative DNA helicase [Chlorobiaceae bacterium]
MIKPKADILDFSKDIDFNLEGRVPPYSTEIEQEVLACVLLEDDPVEQVIQIFGDSAE